MLSRTASSRNGRSADLPLALLLAATIATACSPSEKGVAQGRTDDPVISLSEGTCVGTCPVYDITLHPNGNYLMNGERYVKTVGVSDGKLGAKAWTATEKVLKEADFWKLDPLQTPANLSNCQPDSPTVKVMWRTSEGKQKTVTYDAGCGVQKMQELVTDLREAMDFDTVVWTDKKFEYAQPLLK